MTTQAAMSPFGQRAENKSGEDFEIAPSGLHQATVIGLIDLGTQSNTYQGKTEKARKIYVCWELATEFNKEGKPFVVGQEYTWSLNGDKAKWKLMLEGWRGRKFTEGEEFDPIVLLGQPCNVTLTEGETQAKKRKFVKVTAVAGLMKGQKAGPTVNPAFAWHLSTWGDATIDPPIPEWVPPVYGDSVVDKIKESAEWAEIRQKSVLIPASNQPPSNGLSSGSSEPDKPPF
jgi:hypothetical protein